jgi:predicted ATPase
MTDTPISIFISYAYADSAFVDRLDADLRQQGFDPWGDRQRLKGGQRWRRELQNAVKRTKVLLIVLSPDAIASENVQIEYNYVLELGNVVIPLYYRQCEVPMELRAIQWIDFRKSYEQGLAALLDVLHRQQEQVAASGSSPQEGARLLEGRPAAPAASEADAASSLVGQQPAAPSKPEPLWKVPSTFTSLVGREQEVAEISALLTQPEMRLVTLVGPGGIGKTRLSLAVATQMRSFFVGGICFVGLAAMNNPQLVVPTIALELGLKESGNRPLLEQVQAFVGEQPFLLVLDNFEQIVAAAPQLEELLAGCPGLSILVTSRAVLHLSAEQVVPVAPLALPSLSTSDTEDIVESAAVTLFVQRARHILPSFQLTPTNARAIAEVCVRLDGLPLAIELAAARVKLLPPQVLLARLSQRLQLLTGGPRSLPVRQQTLRSTIQWSYDLLGPEEQTLFHLLSVFVGGWQLSAAEALCQEIGQADLDVLNTLSALLDNSLIQSSEQGAEEPRFLMLQIVREFGLERLTASGELETTRVAHARYFLALAEQAEPELDGPNQAMWVARLEHEHDNLREALEWALEKVIDEKAAERREIGLRLSVALKEFWMMHGHSREARTFLERALALSEGTSTSLRARVLRAIAAVADFQGDSDRIEVVAKLSLALSRELEDTRGIADSLGLLAAAAWLRGKIVESVSLDEEQVRLLRQVGEPGEVAAALFDLAEQVSTHGEYTRGQALFEEALQLFRQAGNELWIGVTLVHSAAWLWFTLGDLATMRQRLQEGQALITKVGGRAWSAECLWVASLLALSEGGPRGASSLAQESLSIYREMGDPWYSAWSLHLLGRIETQRGEMPAARTCYQQSLALNQQVGEKWMTPFNLEGLASVVATQGALRWAAQLWGAAEALREAIAVPRLPVDRVDYEQAVGAARAQLGEDTFAAGWQEGRTMKLEQVIDDALKRGGEAGKQ